MSEKLSKVVILKVSSSLHEQLREVAQAEDITMSSIIRNAARDYLKRRYESHSTPVTSSSVSVKQCSA